LSASVLYAYDDDKTADLKKLLELYGPDMESGKLVNWERFLFWPRPGTIDPPIVFGEITALIEADADPFATNTRGQTAMHLAAAGGGFELIGRLHAVGVPVDARDGDGRSALSRAIELGHAGAVAALIVAGARRDNDNIQIHADPRENERIMEYLEHYSENPQARAIFKMLRDNEPGWFQRIFGWAANPRLVATLLITLDEIEKRR